MASQTLITGATGFIGRQLTRDLIERGENVRILARNAHKAGELFGEEIEIVSGDLEDTTSLEKACCGVETIYNIAGIYRFGLRQRRALWRTNVEGAENLFSAAASAGVDKVVHLSSGGVLQKSADADTAVLDENDYPSQPSRFCFYKASKWHSEQRALAWAKRGLPVVIASTTCPIGTGDETPTPTGRIVRDFLQGCFPFYCRTGLNFISVADLSRGLQAAAASGRSGERYLLCDENLWLKEFLDLLAQQTGLAAPRFCLPQILIQLIGLGGEAVDLLNPRSTCARVCVETSLQAERIQFFDNSKARTELGWKPIATIQENIAEAVAWFRSEIELDLSATTATPVQTHVR